MHVTLMDSALERIAQARRWMEYEDSREKNELLTSAVQIVGGPFAANLDDLCEYMSRQLAAASLENRVATLDEVSHLLREVRTTWAMRD